MKTFLKFLIAIALVAGAQAQTAVAVHAADYGNINAAPVTPGDVVGPASSTNNAFARWSGTTGKLLQDTSDLTYSTPTLSAPDAFNISSAGSISLTAGGSNKNITLTPSGTGTTVLGVATELNGASAAGMFPFIIGRSGGSANMAIVAYGSNASLRGFGVQGTPGAVSATTSGQTLLNVLGCGYDSSNTWVSSTAFIQFQAQEAYTSAARGTRIDFGTTAIGATTSSTRATIFNNGLFQIGKAGASTAAWGTGGVIFSTQANTWTDNSSATGTVATAVFNSFAAPTINATNASVVYTDLFNIYALKPLTTGNASATRVHTLGIVDSTSATSSVTGGLVVSATLGTTATSVGIGGGNINAGGDINGATVSSAGSQINYNLSAYLTGTVYTLTNTAAAVTGGTTSPSLTIDKAGTYLISGRIQLAYTGATVVAETATVKLRRTNNTAADLTNGSTNIDLPVATTLTYTYGTVDIPPVIYTTAGTTDIVTIFANVSATLGVGTITAEVGGTNITAIRLY